MPQKHATVSPAPARVGRWKVHADVTQRQRAENRIAQGMNRDISVRMREDALRIRDAHAAEYHMLARAECMHVEALADSHQMILVNRNSASAKSGGVVTLILLSAPSISKGRWPACSIAIASSVTAMQAVRAACRACTSSP